MDNPAQTTQPGWNFVDDMHDADFVRRIVDRMGDSSLDGKESPSPDARSVYLADLLLQGDIEKVIQVLNRGGGIPNFSFPSTARWASPRLTSKLYPGFAAIQARTPEVHF